MALVVHATRQTTRIFFGKLRPIGEGDRGLVSHAAGLWYGYLLNHKPLATVFSHEKLIRFCFLNEWPSSIKDILSTWQ